MRIVSDMLKDRETVLMVPLRHNLFAGQSLRALIQQLQAWERVLSDAVYRMGDSASEVSSDAAAPG